MGNRIKRAGSRAFVGVMGCSGLPAAPLATAALDAGVAATAITPDRIGL